MAEEFTTRDVFEQVDARLTNVEQDLRALRSDMNGQFNRVRLDIVTQGRWHIGVLLTSWFAVMASIWLKQ
jgi:hypothetical protein